MTPFLIAMVITIWFGINFVIALVFRKWLAKTWNKVLMLIFGMFAYEVIWWFSIGYFPFVKSFENPISENLNRAYSFSSIISFFIILFFIILREYFAKKRLAVLHKN